MVFIDLVLCICSVSSLSRLDSQKILTHPYTTAGSYILRHSQSSTHKYSLDICVGNSVLRYRIHSNQAIYADQAGGMHIEGADLNFTSLEALIEYYHSNVIDPSQPCKLTTCCSQMTPSLNMVREENELEVANNELKFESLLYDGRLHKVWHGHWNNTSVTIKVAKQETVPQASLLEIKIMKRLRHPNIVKLLAVCTVSDPITLVLEHLRNAVRLSDHLQQLKQQPSLKFIIQVAAQIASAMEYLAKLNIVHCHLKASSIQLVSQQRVKVTNFYYSRILQDGRGHAFTTVNDIWNAPEMTQDRIVTNRSDVWSFGILLYEMLTHGKIPYEGIETRSIGRMLKEGYRLPCPSGCEDSLYEIMLDCWRWNHDERLDFSQLLVAVQNLSGECIL